MSAKRSEIIIPKSVFCDFCGGTAEEVGKLVRSRFGVHICKECAEQCLAMLTEDDEVAEEEE